ncbi:signal peptidase I [Longimicrobium sp.]|jgi:signal peptidase I|uniref:signal peptidase I n=1 Tax=Longimicrobium sp. TaxID=2029185 RepID=UPI002ED8D72D
MSQHAAPAGRRSPRVAVLLSIVGAPLGHMYAGRARRGILLHVAMTLTALAALAASMEVQSRAPRIGFLLVIPLAWVVVLADAWRTAGRARADAPRRRYQRWWVYVVVWIGLAFVVQPAVYGAATSRWRAFKLGSRNMMPTLLPGDYVMARQNVAVPRGALATRADSTGAMYMSRIAAVAGDVVQMRRGDLLVNGRVVIRSPPFSPADDIQMPEFAWQSAHLAGVDTAGYRPTMFTWGPLKVPAGHVFVLGDNLPGSFDSRHFGFVRERLITGRVEWIYLSRDPATGEIRWPRIGRGVE